MSFHLAHGLRINHKTALVVAPPVNLASANPTFSVVDDTLELNWPPDHIGWWLQMQTNALDCGLETNWMNVPNFNTTNRVWIPIDLANGCRLVRLYYPN